MMDFELGNEGGHVNESVFHFSEKSVRLGFLRKVYAILSVQLVLTAAVVAAFIAIPSVKEYVGSPAGSWVSGVSMFGVIAFLLAMSCFEQARRSWPTNIICLLGFTVFESVLLGSIASRYEPGMVLTAAGITAVVTFGLTLYALQTKYDFTMLGGILFVCLFALIAFSIVAIFVPSQILQVGISAMGAVLFGIYLVFDTQMMLGGRHKYAISPEEYIFAALNLYLDIVNLFLYILSILNEGRRK